MINKIGVVGAGSPGVELAQQFVVSGFKVVLADVSDEMLKKANARIVENIDRLRKEEMLMEDPEDLLRRFRVSSRFEELHDSDFVIEFAKEKTEVKRQALGKIGRTVDKECIIATGTSIFPVSDLAASVPGRKRFIGIHFPKSPSTDTIVEIAMGEDTSQETYEAVVDLLKNIGKDSVQVKKDVPGLIVNRINARTVIEAFAIVGEGHKMENLDAMMKYRLGYSYGMFEFLDSLGIDVFYNISNEMIRRGFNARLPEMLGKMIEDGKLGRKTGSGFYNYPKIDGMPVPAIIPSEEMYSIDPMRIVAVAANEVSWIIRNDVASADDVQKIMITAVNWPEGPLTLADSYGTDRIIDALKKEWSRTGEDRYRPDQMLLEMASKGNYGKSSGKGFLDWTYGEMDFGPVHYEKRNDHALIVLNRPGKMNAMNEDVWSGLRLALNRAENDVAVRSVVLTGSGRVFSAGNDIEMMAKWESAIDSKSWLEELALPVIELLSSLSKPLITAVSGYALGGACEFSILSDIVIAAEDAIFSIPEGLIGAIPPVATSYGYGLISRKLARYALTGDKMSASEARELGIVDVVAEKEQMPSLIVEFTEKARKIAPMSAKAMKNVINSTRRIYSSQVGTAAESFALLSSSADFAEGLVSAMGKRKPEWKGR